MGFENAEFYIKRWPQLDGRRFENVLISFPDAIPCGIKVAADCGKIILNPDDNYVLKEGDEVLVIAEDDDTYAPCPCPEVINIFFMYQQYTVKIGKFQNYILCYTAAIMLIMVSFSDLIVKYEDPSSYIKQLTRL